MNVVRRYIDLCRKTGIISNLKVEEALLRTKLGDKEAMIIHIRSRLQGMNNIAADEVDVLITAIKEMK